MSPEAQSLPQQFLLHGELIAEGSSVIRKRRGFRAAAAAIVARFGNLLLAGLQTRFASLEAQQDVLFETLAAEGQAGFDSLAANLRSLQAAQQRVASSLDRHRVEELAASGRLIQKIDALESGQSEFDDRLQRSAAAQGQYLAQIQAELPKLAGQIVSIPPPKPVFPVGDRLLATEINGFPMLLPAEDVRLSTYLAIRGNLDPGMVQFFSRVIQPGMTFVDVGANIGIHTLVAASRVRESGMVHSFEPTPRTCEILRTNVLINGYSGRVKIHELALTDKRGGARLWTGDVCGHNTLFGSEQDSRPSIEVETLSLDEALAAVPSIDFVKIDAEGAEPFILRGMRQILSKFPRLQLAIEFAPVWLEAAGLHPCDFIDEILGMGFNIDQIDDITGETAPVSRESMLRSESMNLHLRPITT